MRVYVCMWVFAKVLLLALISVYFFITKSCYDQLWAISTPLRAPYLPQYMLKTLINTYGETNSIITPTQKNINTHPQPHPEIYHTHSEIYHTHSEIYHTHSEIYHTPPRNISHPLKKYNNNPETYHTHPENNTHPPERNVSGAYALLSDKRMVTYAETLTQIQ